MQKYFPYGNNEIDYLKSKDKRLGAIIDEIGKIYKPVIANLFEALVYVIVGQQISTKAHASIWQKIKSDVPTINAKNIATASASDLQKFGLSARKVAYMQAIAKMIENKELDLNAFKYMQDKEVCAGLTKLPGIGIWSAQMLLIFSMQRPNILSYDDLAIRRGLTMIYRHKKITPQLFEKYYKRYSPYYSVASLYIWEVAGGAIPHLRA